MVDCKPWRLCCAEASIKTAHGCECSFHLYCLNSFCCLSFSSGDTEHLSSVFCPPTVLNPILSNFTFEDPENLCQTTSLKSAMGHYSSGGSGECREVQVDESHISTCEAQSEVLLSLKNDYVLPEGTITYLIIPLYREMLLQRWAQPLLWTWKVPHSSMAPDWI